MRFYLMLFISFIKKIIILFTSFQILLLVFNIIIYKVFKLLERRLQQ